jgi:transposase-like protein
MFLIGLSKQFTIAKFLTPKSIPIDSKKPLDKWLKYAKCKIAGYSIRKSAKIVEINIATSFFLRHKILDCIRSFFDVGSVEGVIEADEVLFSYNII